MIDADPVHGVNGVFSGGGIKGVALAGAAAGVMDSGYRFDHVVGTSAGALVASLVAAGYGVDDLEAAVRWVPWPELINWLPVTKVPFVGKALAMAIHKAQCSGEGLERTWEVLLQAKGVRTFGDIPPNTLRIVTTDITHQRGVVLPDHLPEYGIDPSTFPIARAVRMSAAVPFLMRPVRVRNEETGDVSLFSDGALTANFPVRVARWSPIWPVVGFQFLDPSEHPHLHVRGPASLARAVIGAGIRAAEIITSHADDVLIGRLKVDRDPLDFNLSPDEASELFDAGRRAATAYLNDNEIDQGEPEPARPGLRGDIVHERGLTPLEPKARPFARLASSVRTLDATLRRGRAR